MLKLITNMQISRRLLCAFLLAALIPGILIAILGFAFINDQKSRSMAIQTNVTALSQVMQAKTHLVALERLLDDALANNHNGRSLATIQDQINEQVQQFTDAVKYYQAHFMVRSSSNMAEIKRLLTEDDPHNAIEAQQVAVLNQITQQIWPAYIEQQQQLMNALNNKAAGNQIDSLYQSTHDQLHQVHHSWQQVVNQIVSINKTISGFGLDDYLPILLAMIVAFLVNITIVTAIGYIIYLTIARPLHQLAILSKRIARGETDARATITGKDEIALVSRSINNMLDSIVQLVHATETQHDQLHRQIEKLIGEVSGVGEGDLRVQAEVSTDTLGVLADSFNYMIEELGSLVVRVKSVAQEVEQTTTAILAQMTQMVDRDSLQLRQIAATNTEIERMTDTSHKVAAQAQDLLSVARSARLNAQTGREAIFQAFEGMGRINENVQLTSQKVQGLDEHSRQITDIVDAISGIAHQTNRLALDAAIQAAMAGENGKGFGAVAADIRRLAERTKEQANMVTQVVRAIREEIRMVSLSMQDTETETTSGTQRTEEAGSALASIFEAVEHQAFEIEQINQLAMQQLQSTRAVSQIMQGVFQVTQKESQSTHTASSRMEHLAQLVSQLRTSVAAFKLRDNQLYSSPSINIFPDHHRGDGPLTVSGIFRAIGTVSQPLRLTSNGPQGNSSAPKTDEAAQKVAHADESVVQTDTPMPETTEQLQPLYTLPVIPHSHIEHRIDPTTTAWEMPPSQMNEIKALQSKNESQHA